MKLYQLQVINTYAFERLTLEKTKLIKFDIQVFFTILTAKYAKFSC